jgi:hypothetical protein
MCFTFAHVKKIYIDILNYGGHKWRRVGSVATPILVGVADGRPDPPLMVTTKLLSFFIFYFCISKASSTYVWISQNKQVYFIENIFSNVDYIMIKHF